MNIGPPGGEINPLSLVAGWVHRQYCADIEKDGIQLFDASGTRFTEKKGDRLLVSGPVRIVVDAFDRTNMNPDRRRLGLYKLGYQVLKADGTPAPGFDEPRINILFNRLPRIEKRRRCVCGREWNHSLRQQDDAVSLRSDEHGSRWARSAGRLGYNAVAERRLCAADHRGGLFRNEAQEGRDVLITVVK